VKRQSAAEGGNSKDNSARGLLSQGVKEAVCPRRYDREVFKPPRLVKTRFEAEEMMGNHRSPLQKLKAFISRG
jgi:hypothetical protein